MIAVVFLVLLVAVMLVAAMFGQTTGPLPIAELLVLIALFCLFFGAGVYIAAVLGVLGLIFGFAFSDRPFWLYIGQMLWNPSSNFLLVAIPLFLLMGEIMLRAGLSEKLYRALNRFLHRMPGGLLHTNIVSCGVFSAVSGSSVATAATMGSVALPYFANTNYSPRWVLGSLAAGGALGNLIPPGITFILYGLLTDTSVGKLYFAALGPSALVLALFTAVIFWHGLGKRPARACARSGGGRHRPRALGSRADDAAHRHGARHDLRRGRDAHRVGRVRRRRRDDLRRDRPPPLLAPAAPGGGGDRAHDRDDRAHPARRLPAEPHPHQHPGAAEAREQSSASLPLPPWAIMLIIVGFYLALGTFMEGFSMIITTIPVIFPVVKALGYDPIWFGVIITMLVEIALISPPDGTVLYVLQGMRPDRGSITDVFWGVLPFLGVYILAILVLMFLPEIALWLPRVAM